MQSISEEERDWSVGNRCQPIIVSFNRLSFKWLTSNRQCGVDIAPQTRHSFACSFHRTLSSSEFADKMMRQQLLRPLRRSQKLARLNATQHHQNFSTSGRRMADVELTVDGQKVTVPGA